MRKIKFRVWCSNGFGSHRKDPEMHQIDLDEQYNDTTDWYIASRDGIIMQYTGLKDKNGTEIYESDIMKTESGICIVIWYEKGACFRWLFNENSESPLNYDDREVIGNIWENSELLK